MFYISIVMQGKSQNTNYIEKQIEVKDKNLENIPDSLLILQKINGTIVLCRESEENIAQILEQWNVTCIQEPKQFGPCQHEAVVV